MSYGPFETGQEARQAAHAIVPPVSGWHILGNAGNERILRDALGDVETGAYDEMVLRRLADKEDAEVSAVAGWITRAFEAGQRKALEGAVTHWGLRFTCPGDEKGTVQRYTDEDDAYEARRQLETLGQPHERGTVVSRQAWTGPWKEAA